MSMESDVTLLANRCRKLFDLGALVLPQEYRYASVGHCVLDAVFSIGVRYSSTRLVVKRYCEKRGVTHIRSSEALPPPSDQEPLSAFVNYIDAMGPSAFADNIVHNHQRTSPRSGILKAVGALRFAKVLRSFRVEYLQDLSAHTANASLDSQLRAITGMKSGIAVQYFWMLAGSEDMIKPDRMVLRFIEAALMRPFTSIAGATTMVTAAAQTLRHDFPALNARLLDYAIWEQQRTQPKSATA
jgi:hypothetical protein